jgi:hypothetical protein
MRGKECGEDGGDGRGEKEDVDAVTGKKNKSIRKEPLDAIPRDVHHRRGIASVVHSRIHPITLRLRSTLVTVILYGSN